MRGCAWSIELKQGALTGNPLERSEPRSALGESLSDFLGLVSASEELRSHN